MALTPNILGVVTVETSGTPVRLTSTPTFCVGMVIVADRANSGIVYVGPSGVTAANGYPLSAGDPYPLNAFDGGRLYGLENINLADFYIDASDNNQSVRVHYYTRSA